MSWIIGLVALAAFGWFVWGARNISHASKGATIPKEARPNAALLVLDIQPTFLETAKAGDVFIETILRQITTAKNEGMTVIALEHSWRTPVGAFLARVGMKGEGLPGHPKTPVLPVIHEVADYVLPKSVQDGFADGALDALLMTLDVGHLRIIGVDGIFCVRATTIAALNRGYAVEVQPGAVASIDSAKWSVVLQKLIRRGANT